MVFQKIASLRTAEAFRNHIESLDLELGFDETLETGPEAPLARPLMLQNGYVIGNRFCVQPMEGWDGTTSGLPTELTRRRWQRFGRSGAKLIWGGEAAAVMPEGRANPNQLIISGDSVKALARLREALMEAHAEQWSTDDLCIGLQLTHSGRFCRPWSHSKLEPRILYTHPLLNPKFGLSREYPALSDEEIGRIIQAFIRAAALAHSAGFDFVDIKHCHGYLGHEFLSAYDRPGPYGGSFENRTRFLREIVDGVREKAPGLEIAVRLSAFDFIPFQPGVDGVGEAVPWEGSYSYAFGGDSTGTGIDLDEPHRFLDLLSEQGIQLVNITAGSPYYVPHIQRPAMFPPSDGYLPPEDPLVGAARLIKVTADLKASHPDLVFVGTGYSYLQEWLPNVAQHVVRKGGADFVGFGRMVLSYPDMPADVLAGRPLQRSRICRTFSDCTSAPRGGMVSGCYRLDDFYGDRPEADVVLERKGQQ